MATKLEELIVQIRADNQNLITELKKSQMETKNSMATMSKSIQSMVDNSNKSMFSFKKVFETAVGFIGGQAVIGAFNSAKDAALAFFKTLVTDGISAAQVQEDAIQRLNTQLALNGDYSKGASQDMQNFASEMQRTTRIGDEQVLQMLALAKTFGKSNEETKKLTEAAIELSAATGLSLESSIKNLGKTYAGMTGELGESLPIIRTLTAEQLKAGAALDLILNRFGGSAAAQIKTYSGGVQQLSNTYGDFQEKVGALFTENTAVISVIGELNQIFVELGQEVSDNKMAFQALIKDGIILLAESAPIAVASIHAVVDSMMSLRKAHLTAAGALADFFGDTESADAMATSLYELEKRQDSTNKKFEDITASALNMSNRIVEAAESGAASQEEMNKVYEAQSEAARKAREEQVLLTEAQKKMGEDGKALTEELLLGMEENNEAKIAIMTEQLALEQEILAEARAQELITKEEHEAALAEIGKKFNDKVVQDLVSSEQKKAQIRQQYASQYVNLAASTAGLITAITGKESKAAFLLQKGAAIAQAIVSTNLAAAQALAVPPAPNFALAGVAKSAGYVNVAAIAATAVQGFQKGIDMVPGIGFQDTVPAMLTPGERVVPKETNRDLTRFLQGQSSPPTSQSISIELSLRDELVEFIEAKLIERRTLGIGLGAA